MSIGLDVSDVHLDQLIDLDEEEEPKCSVCGDPIPADDENGLCAKCEDIFDTSEFSQPDIEWDDVRLLTFAEWFGYNIEPNPNSTLGYSVTSPSGKKLGGFVAKRIIAAFQKNPEGKKDGAKPPKAGGTSAKGKSGGGSGGAGGGAKKSGGTAGKSSAGGGSKAAGTGGDGAAEKPKSTRTVNKRLEANQATVDMIGRLDDAAREEFWKANASLAKDLAAQGFTVEEDGSVFVRPDGVGMVAPGFNRWLSQQGITSHLTPEEKAVAKVAKKEADAVKKLADTKTRAADSIAAVNPAGMEESTKGKVKSGEVQAIIDRHKGDIEGATDPKAVAAAVKAMKDEIAAYKKAATAPPTEAQALASTIGKLKSALPRGVDVEAPNLPADQAQAIIDKYRGQLDSAPDAEAAKTILKDMRNEIRNTKEANAAAAKQAKADTAAIQKEAKSTATAQKAAKSKGWEPQEVVKPKDAAEREQYRKAVEAKAATDPDYMYSVIESGDGTMTVIKKPKDDKDTAAKLGMELEKLAAKGTTIPPEVTAFLQQHGMLKQSAMKSAPLPPTAPAPQPTAPVGSQPPAQPTAAEATPAKDAQPTAAGRKEQLMRRPAKMPQTASEWGDYYADQFDGQRTFEEEAASRYYDWEAASYVVLIPDDKAKAELAMAGGEAADILHLTLAYFDNGFRATDFLTLENMTRWGDPLKGKISGIGRFHAKDEDCIVALPDVPDLNQYRSRLESDAISREHGFTPHITLRYIPTDAPTPKVPWREIPVTFDVIEVWQKDGQRMRFPFKSEPDPYGPVSDYR